VTETDLTPAQERALRNVRHRGVQYAYDGVSRSTIAALERRGLVAVEWSITTWWNRLSGRNHSQCDWIARPK
jgi:hypothetical protein